MKNPPHPGAVVLQECIEPLNLTITQAAAALGVTRNTLSELVNGKRGISPEMAVRLGSARVRTTPLLSIARSVACTDGAVPKVPVRELPPTSGALFAVNGLALLKLTTDVP